MLDKRLLVTCASLLVVVAASGAAALLAHDCDHCNHLHLNYGPAAQVINPLANLAAPQTEPDYLYIIKEYDGRVAVFARGERDPEMILERLVHHLPTYDRIQLKEGVRVFTQEELQERIEDYTS